MKFIYAKYNLSSKRKLLDIIRNHRLHNPNPYSKMLEWSQLPAEEIESVAIVYRPSTIYLGYRTVPYYVGSAIITNFIDYNTDSFLPCNLGVWVDPLNRRMGIGSKLTNLIKENSSHKLIPWNLKGIPKAFYDNVLG